MRWFCAVIVKFASALFYVVFSSSLQALVLTQDNYLYRVWSVDAGLPQISVTAMVQDAEGFLWLGTQNGLSRFDGVQFEVFNTSNTAAMSSNVISELFIDSHARLWIGTANGLMRYQNGQFERLDKSQPLQGAISGFAELPDGRFFIGGKQLYQWQQEQIQPVAAHRGPVFQLQVNQDSLFIGGQNGFATLDGNDYQWHSVPKNDTATAMQISELAIQDGQVYLGTTSGLFRWQPNFWQKVELAKHAGDQRIELLFVDKDKRLWVSNYSNVYVIEDDVVRPADYVKGQYQEFDWVESMLHDKHNNLWFGSRTHGLKRLRKPPTQRFSKAHGIPDPYTWAVLPWQQQVLVGTNGGLSLLQHGTFQPLKANQYLQNSFVYSLLADGSDLWVGTRGGLSLLDHDTLAWRRNYDQIGHLLVTTIAKEKDLLWVGTNAGLYYLHQDELQQTGLPEALTDVKVRIVMPDTKQRLWIGTENGLYVRDDDGFKEVDDVPLAGSFI